MEEQGRHMVNALEFIKSVAVPVCYLQPWVADDVSALLARLDEQDETWLPSVSESAVGLFMLDAAMGVLQSTLRCLSASDLPEARETFEQYRSFGQTLDALSDWFVKHGDQAMASAEIDEILKGVSE